MAFKVNTEAATIAVSKNIGKTPRSMRTLSAGNAYALGLATLRRDGGGVILGMRVERESDGTSGNAEAKLYRESLVALRDEIERLLEEGVSNG
jgi:hypothetical protein